MKYEIQRYRQTDRHTNRQTDRQTKYLSWSFLPNDQKKK